MLFSLPWHKKTPLITKNLVASVTFKLWWTDIWVVTKQNTTTYLRIFYNQRDAIYTILYYYQRCTCFGWFFRPSTGAYKTVYAALGIVMLSCCLPLVCLGWNCNSSIPTTPEVDSRKAWHCNSYTPTTPAVDSRKAWHCNSYTPTTPAVDSRKAWQYPRLHIQFYKLLMMGGKQPETCRALIIIKNIV